MQEEEQLISTLSKKKKKGSPLPPVVHAVLDPASEAGAARGRVIIVGDVHGCTEELRELLDKLHYRPPRSNKTSGGGGNGESESENGESDLLVFVGDLVNKGPDPIGTLELAMASGGVCVRGNHDEAAVALRRRMDKEGEGREEAAAAEAAGAAAMTKEKKKKKKENKDKKKDKAALLPVSELLEHMPWVADPRAQRGLRWLAESPFSLRLESRGVTVVHAGLVPKNSSSSSDPSSSSSSSSSSATSVESQRLEDLLEVRHVARDFPSAAAAAAGAGAAAAAAPAATSSSAAAAAAATSPPSPPSPSSGGWRAIDKKLAKQAEKEGAHASGLLVSLWAREYLAAAAAAEGDCGGGGEAEAGGGGKKLSLSSLRSAGHVVFGHHASLGLQQERSATGIDTGCVLGGELTALVLGPLPLPESGVCVGGEKGEGDRKKKKAAAASPPSSLSAGWKNLPGGAELVSIKARRAYVGKEAADAGAEEC